MIVECFYKKYCEHSKKAFKNIISILSDLQTKYLFTIKLINTEKPPKDYDYMMFDKQIDSTNILKIKNFKNETKGLILYYPNTSRETVENFIVQGNKA